MTEQQVKEQDMIRARNAIQHENDIRREAFDSVPRTLLCSGVVFLSLVVPLYFGKVNSAGATQVSFRIAACSMMFSIILSGILFGRTIRVASASIRQLTPIARGTEQWDEIGTQVFRWWEWCVFVAACTSFIIALIALIVAMFVN